MTGGQDEDGYPPLPVWVVVLAAVLLVLTVLALVTA